jgi:hypothetical protein
MLATLLQKGLTAKGISGIDSERIVIGPFSTVFEANKALDLVGYSANIVGIIRQMTPQDSLNGIRKK